MTSPVTGVYVLVEEEREGYLFMSGTHFCEFTVKKNRTPWPAPIPPALEPSPITDEMRLEAWGAILGTYAGTYEVVEPDGYKDGDEIEVILQPDLRHTPFGRPGLTCKVTIEGDRFTLTSVRTGQINYYRRVG